MQFSEANTTWRPIPEWVKFMVRLGFAWPGTEPAIRRIVLISMPCDSAAAGLITLGAMRGRLELNDANDLTLHFQRIEAGAIQGDRTFLYHRALAGRRRGPYVLDGQAPGGMVWAKLLSAPERRTISSRTATDWQFAKEAPVQILDGERVLYEQHYAQLVEGGAPIPPSNLLRSDSGICLAGRVTGEISTRSILAAIRFRAPNNCVADLSQLLTVQSWSPGMTSRVSFFNSRTGQLDRTTGRPRLVVADGDACFLRTIDQEEFRQSDIVGVIHLTIERDRLRSIGDRLSSLRQWYAADEGLASSLPTPPHGIALLVLRRR